MTNNDTQVLGSKRIRVITTERYEIRLPGDCSQSDFDKAKEELLTMRDHLGYDSEIIVQNTPETTILSFNTVTTGSGLDYNNTIFSNIIWVEDLVERG